jgi:predicted outer membrane protein
MTRSLCLAILAAATLAAGARAQNTAIEQQSQPGAARTQTPGAPQGEAGQLDQAIAACLQLGNQEEIAVAQFAEGRVQSNEAKQFVAMMLRDHRAALEKLQRVAPQLASLTLQVEATPGAAGRGAAPGRTPQPGAQPAGVQQAGAPRAGQPTQPGQAARLGQPGANSPMIALQQRVAQECVQLTLKELSEHEGADFDKCYIGQQIGAHVGMLAKLRGSQEFASGELRQLIDEMTGTVEGHLDQAKQIAKSMKDQSPSAGTTGEQARRDGTAPRRQ